jgi:hypothetical protein
MSDWLYESRNRRDRVTVPTIWVAIVLSVLVHVAALWTWLPQIRLHMLDKPDRDDASGSLVVRLAPSLATASSPPPSPAMKASPPAAPRTPSRKVTPRPQPAPPVIALDKPAAETPAPSAPAPPPATTARPQPPAAGDLSSYIEARRRAREEPSPSAASPPAGGGVPAAPPTEDAGSRTNRIVAENLGLNRKPTFGPDPTFGGGIFHIQRMGYNDAEFFFYGWNKDIRRNTTQLIEVRKGDNSDIRIAVIRRMIQIIREHEKEDFVWESKRLGRNISLSARARDNAGLEDFLMLEFFSEGRGPR